MTLKELIFKTRGYSSIGLYDKQGKLIGDLDAKPKDILEFQNDEVIENKLAIFNNDNNTYIKMCVFLDTTPCESNSK